MEDRAKVKMIICDRRCLGGILYCWLQKEKAQENEDDDVHV